MLTIQTVLNDQNRCRFIMHVLCCTCMNDVNNPPTHVGVLNPEFDLTRLSGFQPIMKSIRPVVKSTTGLT